VGKKATVARIFDDESKMLRYLAELGLVPGTAVHITHIAPFDGPITIVLNGESKVIGQAVAQAVLVILEDEL
jgi:DtxR family Mn-dependent transcriptional regulator